MRSAFRSCTIYWSSRLDVLRPAAQVRRRRVQLRGRVRGSSRPQRGRRQRRRQGRGFFCTPPRGIFCRQSGRKRIFQLTAIQTLHHHRILQLLPVLEARRKTIIQTIIQKRRFPQLCPLASPAQIARSTTTTDRLARLKLGSQLHRMRCLVGPA